MPKEEKTPLRARAQVDQKSTFRYQEKPEVVSRPTTEPVQNYANTEAAQILAAIGSMSNDAAGFLKQLGIEEERKGQTAALKGEQAEASEKTRRFMEGYDAVSGSGSVHHFDNEMLDLFTRSSDLSPEEFTKSKQEIVKKYTKGKSDVYLRAFTPGALDRENHWDRQFLVQKKQQLDAKLLSDVVATSKQNMTRIHDDHYIENKGAAMRANLSFLQARAKDLGLSRQQISEAYLNAVGEEAVTQGKPELLSFVHERDDSGVALADNVHLQAKIYDYKRAATAKREAMEHKAEIELKRRETETKNAVERGLIDAYYSNDPAKVSQGLRQLQASKSIIPPREYEHYMNAFSEINGTNAVFRQDSDIDRLTMARAGIAEGTYGISELRADKQYFSRQDYVQNLEKINAKRQHDIYREEAGERKDANEKNFDEMKAIGRKAARAPVEVGMNGVERYINPHAAMMRESMFVAEVNEMWNHYYRVEKKLPAGCETWRQATDYINAKAYYKVFQQYPEGHVAPDDPDAKFTQRTTAPTKSNTGPNKAALNRLRGLK